MIAIVRCITRIRCFLFADVSCAGWGENENWPWAKVLLHAFPSTFNPHCGSEIIIWKFKKVFDLKELKLCRGSSRKLEVAKRWWLATIVMGSHSSQDCGWYWYDWAVCSWKALQDHFWVWFRLLLLVWWRQLCTWGSSSIRWRDAFFQALQTFRTYWHNLWCWWRCPCSWICCYWWLQCTSTWKCCSSQGINKKFVWGWVGTLRNLRQETDGCIKLQQSKTFIIFNSVEIDCLPIVRVIFSYEFLKYNFCL